MVARGAVCLHGAGKEAGVHGRAEGAEAQKVDHHEWQEPSAEVLLLCSCSHPAARHRRSSTPVERSSCRINVLNIVQKGPKPQYSLLRYKKCTAGLFLFLQIWQSPSLGEIDQSVSNIY
jgi:hypothetical protein